MSVGRAKKNNLAIANGSVSTAHCVIFSDGVTDNSSYGTYLSGRNIEDFKMKFTSDYVNMEKD